MWNWKNQGNGEKFYNMSQNWGNPTTVTCKILSNVTKYCTEVLLLCRSAWVGRSVPSVCLSVCPQHNSKASDPKVLTLGNNNNNNNNKPTISNAP